MHLDMPYGAVEMGYMNVHVRTRPNVRGIRMLVPLEQTAE